MEEKKVILKKLFDLMVSESDDHWAKTASITEKKKNFVKELSELLVIESECKGDDHWGKTANITEEKKDLVKKLSYLLVSESGWEGCKHSAKTANIMEKNFSKKFELLGSKSKCEGDEKVVEKKKKFVKKLFDLVSESEWKGDDHWGKTANVTEKKNNFVKKLSDLVSESEWKGDSHLSKTGNVTEMKNLFMKLADLVVNESKCEGDDRWAKTASVIGLAMKLSNLLVKESEWKGDDHWGKTAIVMEEKKNFVKKLSNLLDLAAVQSWEVFQFFLVNEYTKADSSLPDLFTSQRDEESFRAHLLRFYLGDRLHLLRCLRHIVANTANPQHPYQSLFSDFMRDVLDKDGMLEGCLLQQVINNNNGSNGSTSVAASSMPPDGPIPGPSTHLAHHLAELQEILATLLVYYSSTGRSPLPATFKSLVQLAQGGGLGGQPDLQEGLREIHMPLVEALDATHALLLVLTINVDMPTSGHSLCESEWVNKLDPIMAGLGARKPHLAPLLAWAVLHLRAAADRASTSTSSAYAASTRTYHRLAERALSSNVFSYLQTALSCAPIQGDKLLLRLASSVVYSLVCATATCLPLAPAHQPVLSSLAKTLLAQDPPADLFWAEEDGGAGLLLPHALEVFPYEVEPLLSLATALAGANPDSCLKVIELLSEVPYLTWPLELGECPVQQVREGGYCTMAPLQLLPSITVPARTCGSLVPASLRLVAWNTPTNAWQVLLSIMNMLGLEVSSGATVADPQVMKAVCSTLQLVTAVLATLPSQLPALVHVVHEALVLLRRMSHVSRPPGVLVAALLAMLAEVSTQEAKNVWTELEGSPLLPYLALPESSASEAKRGKADPFVEYRAGGLRALVCGEEAAMGTYPILRSYTSLLAAAIKGGVRTGSVQGGVVFMAREVTGAMMRWWYRTQEERDKLFECCLTLLHHTLEDPGLDPSVHTLVVHQLVDRSSAGRTLLSVVESGASLEGMLSLPSHSPASTQALRLTRTAQMALSILHRLVGEESSTEGLSQLLRATPLPGVPLGSSPGVGRGQGSSAVPHLALTVALYAHQRLNPRLLYLALRTLTRFAQKLDVPLVACFGAEADGIRDALLRRLESPTEDVRVKVALLRLLTASTTRQQGLTNAFLTPPEKLLDPLVSLASLTGKGSMGHEVVLAVVELVDALWTQKYSTATRHMQAKKEFCDALTCPLTSHKPGEVSDAIVGHCFSILARQLFCANSSPPASLSAVKDRLFSSGSRSSVCLWSEHVLSKVEDGWKESRDVREVLVPAWRDFVVVLVMRARSWLTPQLKVKLAEDILEGLLRQVGSSEEPDQHLTLLLAEVYIALVKHCSKQLAEKQKFFEQTSKLLACLQGVVMTTSTHCQLLILGASLSLITLTDITPQSHNLVACLVGPVGNLVQQHGRLAGSAAQSCTSASTLGLATALLHQLLLRCQPDTAQQLLTQFPVVPALLHATETYMKSGDEEVVGEMVNLLATLCRTAQPWKEVSAQTLSSTLTLAVPSSKTNLLSGVVWCMVWGVRHMGAMGVEGGVNVAAIHLQALCGSLAIPHKEPNLALASAALVEALAPHTGLWVVLHQASFTQLTAATTRCIHITKHLLCTPRFVQRELGGESGSRSGGASAAAATTTASAISDAAAAITPATTAALNKMLHVLCACLSAIQSLGPDLTDLLCGPGSDVDAWTLFFHPSFRTVSAHDPSAQPSLASLTAVLELYDSHASKESRGVSPCHSGAPEVGLSLQVLALCAEKALLLLLTQATLALMSPDTAPRDAQRIRQNMADDMNSFFHHSLGRRPPASPLPTTMAGASTAGGHTHISLRYLRLAQQLVTRLCVTK
ncbi:nucleoporin NUP188-like isoform X2 [Scylla paramamosain]